MNVTSYGDGMHDAISTSPNGGYFESIAGVSFGTDERGGISIPAFASEASMAYHEAILGRNVARAFAIADLSIGARRAGCNHVQTGGGVSVILEIDSDMPITTMARATITSMEAITCVLQDLDIRDTSGNQCSGCSNLSMVVVRNRGSGLYLHGAGKHSKLGQAIAEAVYNAVRESALINGLPESSRGDVSSILNRASADVDKIPRSDGLVATKDVGSSISAGHAVALASAIASVSDTISWGLLPKEDGIRMGRKMIASVIGGELPPGDDLPSVLAEALAHHIQPEAE